MMPCMEQGSTSYRLLLSMSSKTYYEVLKSPLSRSVCAKQKWDSVEVSAESLEQEVVHGYSEAIHPHNQQ